MNRFGPWRRRLTAYDGSTMQTVLYITIVMHFSCIHSMLQMWAGASGMSAFCAGGEPVRSPAPASARMHDKQCLTCTLAVGKLIAFMSREGKAMAYEFIVHRNSAPQGRLAIPPHYPVAIRALSVPNCPVVAACTKLGWGYKH